MLTIPQRLPIKQMSVYGAAALLVGFMGTLAVLREVAPRVIQPGASVVEIINKRPSATNATLATKQTVDQSSASAAPLTGQTNTSTAGQLSTPQSPRVTATTPTYTPPATHHIASPSVPAPDSVSVNDGGVVSQPAPVVAPPASNEPIIQPLLTTMLSGVVGVEIKP